MADASARACKVSLVVVGLAGCSGPYASLEGGVRFRTGMYTSFGGNVTNDEVFLVGDTVCFRCDDGAEVCDAFETCASPVLSDPPLEWVDGWCFVPREGGEHEIGVEVSPSGACLDVPLGSDTIALTAVEPAALTARLAPAGSEDLLVWNRGLGLRSLGEPDDLDVLSAPVPSPVRAVGAVDVYPGVGWVDDADQVRFVALRDAVARVEGASGPVSENVLSCGVACPVAVSVAPGELVSVSVSAGSRTWHAGEVLGVAPEEVHSLELFGALADIMPGSCALAALARDAEGRRVAVEVPFAVAVDGAALDVLPLYAGAGLVSLPCGRTELEVVVDASVGAVSARRTFRVSRSAEEARCPEPLPDPGSEPEPRVCGCSSSTTMPGVALFFVAMAVRRREP